MKITISELRSLVKQVLFEEVEKEKEEKEEKSEHGYKGKTLKGFADYHNLTMEPIMYNFQGVKRKKGYDLVDSNNNIQIEIEPKDDGWFVKNNVSKSSFRVSNMNEIPGKLKGFKPSKNTGSTFKK